MNAPKEMMDPRFWSVDTCSMLAICGICHERNGIYYQSFYVYFRVFYGLSCGKMLPEIYRLNASQKKRIRIGAVLYGVAAGIAAGKETLIQSAGMILFLIAACALLSFVKEEKKLRLALLVLTVCNVIINGNLMYQPFGANIQDTYLKAGTVQKKYDQKPVREAAKASDMTKMERVDVMTDKGYNPNRAVTMRRRHIRIWDAVCITVLSAVDFPN